jgi:hypothetical protein
MAMAAATPTGMQTLLNANPSARLALPADGQARFFLKGLGPLNGPKMTKGEKYD